jgi:hypothetical protein
MLTAPAARLAEDELLRLLQGDEEDGRGRTRDAGSRNPQAQGRSRANERRLPAVCPLRVGMLSY